MKNKRNTGLCAGVYRESSNQKSTLFDLLASILIFLALAAICYTVSGFTAMLCLLGAGVLTCIAAKSSGISEKRSCCSPFCWRHCCSLSCLHEIRC